MALYYLDTSALVKRYVREVGTAWVTALTDPRSGNTIATERLTGPEAIAALYRKARAGEVTVSDALAAAGRFRVHWQGHYAVMEVTEAIAGLAMDLAERHGLRGYDAVHLAIALTLYREVVTLNLPPLTFISADRSQLRAAQVEGVLVDDPNSHR